MSLVVAICTHNNADQLRATLEMVRSQVVPTSLPWSIMVVNNCCTDNTDDVVKTARDAAASVPIRLVHEPCPGLAHARKCAVRSTSEPLIAFVDDDCLLDPDWIHNAASFAQARPRAGAFGGRVLVKWMAPPTLDALQHEAGFAKQDYGEIETQLPTLGSTKLVGAGLVVRREALIASGWLQMSYLTDRKGNVLAAGGDSEIVLRIRAAGYELWYNPAMRLNHVIPPSRTSVNYLCRLYRGFADSDAVLCALALGRPPTLQWKLQLIMTRAWYLVRRSAAYVILDRVARRPAGAKRRIQVHEALGQFYGSVRFALTRHPRP